MSDELDQSGDYEASKFLNIALVAQDIFGKLLAPSDQSMAHAFDSGFLGNVIAGVAEPGLDVIAISEAFKLSEARVEKKRLQPAIVQRRGQAIDIAMVENAPRMHRHRWVQASDVVGEKSIRSEKFKRDFRQALAK